MTSSNTGGYNPAYFQLLAEIERQHFWFTARRLLISKLTRGLVSTFAPGFRVLEIGCGTGDMLTVLSDSCPQGTVIGMDYFLEGLMFAKLRRDPHILQADARLPPFEQCFDLIGAFDVLEHLPNDRDILRSFYSMLRPKGVLMLTVPAHAWLWSEFDVQARHCRRYAKTELQSRLDEAGFSLQRLSPFMSLSLPLVWLHRRLHIKRRSQAGLITSELRIVPGLNFLLKTLLRVECQLVGNGMNAPFGSSFIAVAERKEE